MFVQKIIIFVLTDTFIWGTIVTTQINHTQNTRAQNGQIKKRRYSMKLMKIGALVMAVLMALAFAAGCTGGVATETPQQPSNPTDNQPPQATAGQGEQPPGHTGRHNCLRPVEFSLWRTQPLAGG